MLHITFNNVQFLKKTAESNVILRYKSKSEDKLTVKYQFLSIHLSPVSKDQ